MASNNGNGDKPEPNDEEPKRRRGRKRRRQMFNLGMPFARVDDFANQSEDAIALGYRVLTKTVEEIQAGYQEAKKFSDAQKAFEDGNSPMAPEIPWEQMVDRLQNFQEIALYASSTTNDILMDAMRSATKSTKSAAKTWGQSRNDTDASPTLAGPVFVEPIRIELVAGGDPVPLTKIKEHRGLARLRINAVIDPVPSLVPAPVEPMLLASNTIADVAFQPAAPVGPTSEKASVDNQTELTFTAKAPANQTPGVYHGAIRASNFELLIARLVVVVKESTG